MNLATSSQSNGKVNNAAGLRANYRELPGLAFVVSGKRPAAILIWGNYELI